MRLLRTYLLALLAALPVSAHAQNGPVLLELYTSQGCSSCPSADALLAELGQSEDVVALAFHVDYWDYLGWKDSFSHAAWTERQHAYAQRHGETMVYTPQMVIGGAAFCVGSNGAEVAEGLMAVAKHPDMAEIAFDATSGQLHLRSLQEGGAYDILLAHVIPQQQVHVARGENRGRALTYTNIVKHLEVVSTWDGQHATFHLALPSEGRAAVFVQESGFGRVVAARWLN